MKILASMWPSSVSQPPDAPSDPNSPAAIKLGEQLDAVERTIRDLSGAHGCYSDIEAQIAAARTQIATGKLAEAQSSYEKASVAAWRAKSSADAEPVAWQLLAVQVGCLILILGLGYLVKRYPSYGLWSIWLATARRPRGLDRLAASPSEFTVSTPTFRRRILIVASVSGICVNR